MNHRTLILSTSLVALAASSLGCGETEECKQLKVVRKARKDVLQSARAQAGAMEVVEKRAAAAEGNATKLMKSLWLNETEGRVHDTLEKRAKVVAGATFDRGTTPVSTDPSPDAPQGTETMWTMRWREADPQALFRVFDEMLASPPLVKFGTLLRDKKGDDTWRLEMIRAAVDQVPINPRPVTAPPAPDLSTIPKNIGFCGAGKLRDEIADANTEIDRLRERAERTTVLLPTAASWEGLRARSELVRDMEMESRRISRIFRQAVLGTGLSLRALGTEEEMVFLEVFGGAKERLILEQELVKLGAGPSLQRPRTESEGVVRFMMPNTIMQAKRNRGAARPELPGEERQPLPADHPAVREKANAAGGEGHP